MAIQVLEKEGIFYVTGTLKNESIHRLSNYLVHYFIPAQQVTVNLEKVVDFDNNAAYGLLKLFISAQQRNSKFTIVGKKNENLLGILKETDTLHIWNQTKYLT